jgi:hypothetical protein
MQALNATTFNTTPTLDTTPNYSRLDILIESDDMEQASSAIEALKLQFVEVGMSSLCIIKHWRCIGIALALHWH